MAQVPPTTATFVDTLPARLRNFFARYPPHIYSSYVATRPTPPENQPTPEQLPQQQEKPPQSPYTADRDAKGYHRPDINEYSPSRAYLLSQTKAPNPFLPRKNFRNGKWISPRFGLRVQADLVKMAAKYNIEELLPPSRKSNIFKEIRRAEKGLQIKGTGIGQKVKGHKWERTMEARLEERKKAMLEMPEMIRLWKQVSSMSFVSRLSLGVYEHRNVWLTQIYYREDTAVAGRNGPSGKQAFNIRFLYSTVRCYVFLSIALFLFRVREYIPRRLAVT